MWSEYLCMWHMGICLAWRFVFRLWRKLDRFRKLQWILRKNSMDLFKLHKFVRKFKATVRFPLRFWLQSQLESTFDAPVLSDILPLLYNHKIKSFDGNNLPFFLYFFFTLSSPYTSLPYHPHHFKTCTKTQWKYVFIKYIVTFKPLTASLLTFLYGLASV